MYIAADCCVSMLLVKLQLLLWYLTYLLAASKYFALIIIVWSLMLLSSLIGFRKQQVMRCYTQGLNTRCTGSEPVDVHHVDRGRPLEPHGVHRLCCLCLPK